MSLTDKILKQNRMNEMTVQSRDHTVISYVKIVEKVINKWYT